MLASGDKYKIHSCNKLRERTDGGVEKRVYSSRSLRRMSATEGVG